MAIKALKLDSVTEYESVYDDAKGTPEATKWLLGTLDSRISGRVKDAATSFKVDANAADEEVETSLNTSAVSYETVQYGLRGFKNFKDALGNDVSFVTLSRRHGGKSYTIVHPDVMDLIPEAVIKELAEEIGKANTLTAAGAKN